MDIRALRENDDRSNFRSGDPDLDRFFRSFAGQNQFRRHIGTTYVAVDGARVLGYATVAAGHIQIESLPAVLRKRLPAYPIPVLRLARLAVDESARDRGIGRALLRFVFRLALKMSADYGCHGVVVDAKPGAVEFHTRFGFTALDVVEGQAASRPEPAAMFLTVAEIAKAGEGG